MTHKHTKILVWSDYCVYTGFANVMSNIMRRISDHDVEIDVVGINHDGRPDYDHDKFPGRVWPARSFERAFIRDIYGMNKVIELALANDYDKIFILQDTYIAQTVINDLVNIRNHDHNKNFEIVYYYPIDCDPLASWIRESAGLVDRPVVYSRFGYESSLAACPGLEGLLTIIPHGIDTHEFYPLYGSEYVQAVRDKLTRGRDTFLLVNVNRNTPRKDIPRSLMVLKELKDRGENVMLYLHCSPKDIGGDFTVIAARMGLQEHIDYMYPHDLDPIIGYPVATLNYIYNAANAVISTSLGEGWGLSITEAMATCTPVIAPAHTAIEELIADERGVPVKAGDDISLWRMIDADNAVLRPMTNVTDMAYRIQELMRQSDRRVRIAENAYQWVLTNLGWDLIVSKQWCPLLLRNNHGNN